MAKKTPKDPQRAALIAAAEAVLLAVDEQPVPTEDLCQAAAQLSHVINRTSGRPGPSVDLVDLIRYHAGQGKSAAVIAAEIGTSEATVRRHWGRTKKVKSN